MISEKNKKPFIGGTVKKTSSAAAKSERRTAGKGRSNGYSAAKGKAAPKNNAKNSARYGAAKRMKPKKQNTQAVKKPSIKVAFLGGLNEIGKNITLFECNGDMFLLDCGMAFPDGEMLGVDLVIPDFTYVEENKDRIKGIVLTHGHEDHIGSLPYLLKNMSFPIYGTALTLGLVGNKLKEHNLLYKTKLNEVKAGDRVKLGCMEIEFIHVNHSIPDAVAVAIHSPAGTIVHTGDFKIDCTPTAGGMIDLAAFARLGEQGVLALFAESTNAERPGYTMTEQKVGESFETLFKRAENNRIIIATFASNISRVQQIINCAEKYGRKVAFSGRSMINYMSVAVELGYLKVPDGVIIDIDLLNRYPAEKVVLVTTGSQGEPMSALSRMAYSDHRKVEVGIGDFIIISANPIPGNEKTVGNVVDELMKRGCEVVYESMYEVHVSGHACQEELKIIHGLTKPQYFIPVHGEQKHLRKHASLAYSMGMDKKNVFIGDIGNVIELNKDYMKQLAPVPAGKIFVDGLGVGDVGSIVLRDRKHLGQDGLIIVVASLDSIDGHIISGPDIVSRGFVYVRESETLMEEIKQAARYVIDDCSYEHLHEWNVIKNKIKDEVSHLIYDKTRRTPMILPIIMEV
ncbi:MAG: RNase J family beta-CASP ribonuclease [Acutalibacteraceae bacterium]